MTDISDSYEPDDYDDDYEEDEPAEEWQEGMCDNCTGRVVQGPLGPMYCACSIGQGADEDDCTCGPESSAS